MTIFFVTHPDVAIDPARPVPDWSLSAVGAARMRAAVRQPERKANEAAESLAGARGLAFATMAALGENDRSATGYLPKPEFEALADRFFAHPGQSVRGWERALDAQRRIVGAFEAVLALARPDHDTAIIAHGAVGALLICALETIPISRGQDQPPGGGGNYFAIDPRVAIDAG
jgi:broad specificity phosphatase PhoE